MCFVKVNFKTYIIPLNKKFDISFFKGGIYMKKNTIKKIILTTLLLIIKTISIMPVNFFNNSLKTCCNVLTFFIDNSNYIYNCCKTIVYTFFKHR